MHLSNLNARSRVLLFAPHPDDESLAAGVFLQRAVAIGAEMRVVYGTDGEKNCWPQRLLERRVHLRTADRQRWGARRQAEALAALRVLQIAPEQVEFLSLPDQGVTDLLLYGGEEILRRLARLIIAWRPTHLIVPSPSDTHPDHSGLAVLLRLVFDNFLPRAHGIARLEYLIHGPGTSFARYAASQPQTDPEAATKARAIHCHVTQLAFSRRRFLAYAQRPERFLLAEKNAHLAAGDGPVQVCARDRQELRLEIAPARKSFRPLETSLYLLGYDHSGALRRFCAPLPTGRQQLDLIDCDTGVLAGEGIYQSDAQRAQITLPLDHFVPSESLFLKLDRRGWFFDEAGWLEVGAHLPRAAATWSRPREARELAVA